MVQVRHNLTTFHGTADLRTLTEEEVRAEILDYTLQDGPVELQPASFGVTSARTDPLALRAENEGKILRLAYFYGGIWMYEYVVSGVWL